MTGDAFTAGTRPGSPVEHTQIKILTVYTLASSETPVPFDVLHEALREHELVNYFALVEALDQLCESGHLEAKDTGEGAQSFCVTQLGKRLVEELSTSLPPALRERASSALGRIMKRRRRLSEVRITETKRDDGYDLELAVPDMGGELVSVRLFVPTERECARIRRRFLNDPVYLYSCILALLTGDIGELGTAREKEELF
ncbi:MAG: DUF4364 family protein [Oscillospiraceae bacterium]|nr:DUF4364 family protein [Oscillospiraceae bacterium]